MPKDPIHRLNAALEGRYRIERELGEGGMATVYLASDLKHERKVALKVLKPELAAVVGAERFLAEIKTTANLQHPHILPLHDSGEADGFLYYVMPYVEGETLRDRLDRERQLPVDEAIGIATAVAGALQTAHEQGVVHRDIKPANILLSRGQPVISDFGIALAVGAAGGERITETRVSLGTPLYMSPEQATGDQHLGPGTDIYALGCVLHEMLAGDPPYAGNTPQAVLGKLLTSPVPNVRDERPSVPENVDAVIRRSLEKVPADRFGRAADLARALADPGFRHDVGGSTADRSGRRLFDPANVAALLAIVLLSAAVGWQLRPSGGPREVSSLELTMPPGAVVRSRSRMPVQSPDGREIVFVAPMGGGASALWRRPVDGVSLTPIAGTEGATAPAYSPDGNALAFVVLQPTPTLRTVARDGSDGRPLLSGALHPRFHDIVWGPDGWIYYSDVGGHIARIPESGGASERVTTLQEDESFHVVADVLPGGRGVLLILGSGAPGGEEVAVVELPGGTHRPLVEGGHARYAATGHVISGTADGALVATPFDLDRLEAVGPSRTLLDGVATIAGDLAESLFTLSESGTLFYLPAAATGNRAARLVWVDRDGAVTLVDPDHEFVPPSQGDYRWSLSPDGGRVALTHHSDDGFDAVWVKSLPDGPFEPLTFGEWALTPVWTPDGRSVTYLSHDPDPTIAEGGLWRRTVDGVGEAELVIDAGGRGFIWPDWSEDGTWLLFRSVNPVMDILGLRPGVDTAAVRLVATGFRNGPPDISPDGRWLAYSSDRSGQHQVYVRSFPNVDSTRVSISVDGGWAPRWAHTGDAIFYVNDAGEMVVARVEAEPRFRVLATEVLFRLDGDLLVPTQREDGFYDVALDDQAFLMARWSRPDEPSRLVVMQNFIERLSG